MSFEVLALTHQHLVINAKVISKHSPLIPVSTHFVYHKIFNNPIKFAINFSSDFSISQLENPIFDKNLNFSRFLDILNITILQHFQCFLKPFQVPQLLKGSAYVYTNITMVVLGFYGWKSLMEDLVLHIFLQVAKDRKAETNSPRLVKIEYRLFWPAIH